jgi:hypothetical protein
MQIDGAIGVALADYESGMCLGSLGGGESFDVEVAAAGNSEVIRAKMKVMEATNLVDYKLEDILISLDKAYHILFMLPGSSLFIYMAFDRKKSNLALARHKLRDLGGKLSV